MMFTSVNIDLYKELKTLTRDTKITYFVGGNGSSGLIRFGKFAVESLGGYTP